MAIVFGQRHSERSVYFQLLIFRRSHAGTGVLVQPVSFLDRIQNIHLWHQLLFKTCALHTHTHTRTDAEIHSFLFSWSFSLPSDNRSFCSMLAAVEWLHNATFQPTRRCTFRRVHKETDESTFFSSLLRWPLDLVLACTSILVSVFRAKQQINSTGPNPLRVINDWVFLRADAHARRTMRSKKNTYRQPKVYVFYLSLALTFFNGAIECEHCVANWLNSRP